MSHPVTHAESSVKRWGGQVSDYLELHDTLDGSKAHFPDNRHRALTHNTWFIFIMEKIYGHEIELHDEDGNVTGKAKVRYICEQHILEDFGQKFIPTAADYLEGMEYQEWMSNGIKGAPSSHRKLKPKSVKETRQNFLLD